jgi:EAL domain-containing protein (putative c-di-GMP-specific phosphodiesterase class I)
VLNQSCLEAAAWHRRGHDATISVNVSMRQLDSDQLVEDVQTALITTGLDPSMLILEVTESILMRDSVATVARLNRLKALGVKVAIDDFGTGYSSLAYLSQLPVDVLKVDKSFIDRVTLDAQDASLAEAIIGLSHTMNFTTVAEGVEQPEQAAWLRQARCTYGQGYLWSRPVELSTAHQLLARPVPLAVSGPLPAEPLVASACQPDPLPVA